MKSLKALTEHLRSLQLINDDAFDSWAESGKLEASGRRITCGFDPTELLYLLQYTAVLSFEHWHGDAYYLFAVINQWLIERDHAFDVLGYPVWDLEFEDDDVANVEIRVQFSDSVYGLPSVPGELPVIIPDPTPDVVTDFDMGAG